MKKTQRTENPYKNSDTNKRYFTYEYYLRKKYGRKLARIPLDMGLTCPNIDGKCSVGGCIYCSSRGSGDFVENASLSLREQYEQGRATLSSKWDTSHCIAYFQAHTNTYAPLEFLKENFEKTLLFDGVDAISIATRADCLDEEICEYLADLAERIPLTVELGLQSSSDKTAELINRGHNFAEFCDGFSRLRRSSDKIEICVHITSPFGYFLCIIAQQTKKVKRATRVRPLFVIKLSAFAKNLLAKGLCKCLFCFKIHGVGVDILQAKMHFSHPFQCVERFTLQGAADAVDGTKLLPHTLHRSRIDKAAHGNKAVRIITFFLG